MKTKSLKKLPPLKFRSILKQVPWGGDRIRSFKHIDGEIQNIGESWEISDVDGSVSEVQEGPFKGLTLTELSHTYGRRLLGRKVFHDSFNGRFPLLIKFIDARQDLSIQVHPDDTMARKLGYSNGKTEMWYIVDAAPEAYLLNGFKQQCSPGEFLERVNKGTVCDVIARQKVASGDCFFIPAGQVHAICSGIFLIEIQQRCDITYRIYDYNRLGMDGNPRQLHVNQALQAINFVSEGGKKKSYRFKADKRCEMVSCDFFTTSRYELTKPAELALPTEQSFTILIAYQGGFDLKADDDISIEVKAGESILLPAEINKASIVPHVLGCSFLEVHV